MNPRKPQSRIITDGRTQYRANSKKSVERRARKDAGKKRTSFPATLITKGATGCRNGRKKTEPAIHFMTMERFAGDMFPVRVPVATSQRPEAWIKSGKDNK